MKTLLARVGVPTTILVLCLVVMAQAQRSMDATSGEIPDANGGNALRESAPARTDSDGNPLRQSGLKAPSKTSGTDTSSRGSLNDPFGPPSGVSGRYATVPAAATSEIPAGGPALMPTGPTRLAEGRYGPGATGAGRTPDARNGQPAPFRPDPSAAPASPMRPIGNAAGSLGSGGFGTPAPAEVDGTAQPGDQQLEGVQTPQLSIQKAAPKEIQVGKPASFRVIIRNTGSVPASEVEVRDQVPRGTRLIGTTPEAKRTGRSDLLWTLGTIRPGEEATVEMQVMPTAEGEIGSVASVRFAADATARSIATRPQLVVETNAPPKVLIGEQMTMSIVVSNPGTGIATGVVLQERIPRGLQHPAGGELEYQVGDLKPGESRRLDLPLVANRPGPLTNVLIARGDGNLRVEDKRNLEVVAPLLDVAVEGPKKRFLERQAKYEFFLSNPGTAPAKGVELVASLPAGLKFMSANNAGYYEESTRTVHWRLEELPVNETGSVELVAMPVEAGQHAIRLRGTAQKGLVIEKQQPVQVDGVAAMLFQVTSNTNPVEIGGETTYEVHVTNTGSKAASNVRMSVLLPPELQPLAAEGPTRHGLDANRVVFDGLGRLEPKAETVYRVRVKAVRPGDLRTRFQLLTDDMQSPVTKEESTRVYADE